MSKRLTKDLNEVNKIYSGKDVSAELENDVAAMWIVTFDGPSGSPYEGGKFKVRFNCDTYPFKTPKINFITKIYHPGVSQDKGEICMKALEEGWVPTMGCKHCIAHILTLLTSPSAENAQDTDVADKFVNHHTQWKATAAEWTQLYAK